MFPHTTQPPFGETPQGQLDQQAAPGLTRRMADRHEALFLKLQPLARQVEAIAARHPESPVPEAVKVLAESLIYESHGFQRGGRRKGLPAAAPCYGPLAAQLAQALAGLVSFEAHHTRWDSVCAAQMWLVRGAPLPVRRLMPRLITPPADKAVDIAALRRKVALRIEQLRRAP